MRKPQTHYVSRGYLTGAGETKTLAKADLERQIDLAIRYASPHVEMRFGLLVCVAAAPGGYHSQVVNPAEMANGVAASGWCQHPPHQHFTDVLATTRMHAAQISWSAKTDDEAHIKLAGILPGQEADLRHWITFQRRYLACKAEGLSDNDAWRIATRDPSFTVPDHLSEAALAAAVEATRR